MTQIATPTPAGPPAQPRPVDTLRDLLEKSRKHISLAVPKHLTAERMIRVAISAFMRTPALQKCVPLSIVGCVVQAAEMGLELTGPLGQAYMVPRWNKNIGADEACFQVGYRGLMDLAYRSGRVETFSARVVYAGDRFSYRYGTKPAIDHVPAMDEPGAPIAVYAVLVMKGGAYDFEVMSKTAIDAHRGRYSKQSNPLFNPWETAWEEMAKKTVIRRLAKRAPVSVEVRQAAALDELGEAGVPQGLTLDLPSGPAALGDASRAAEKLSGNGSAHAVEQAPAEAPEREPGLEPEESDPVPSPAAATADMRAAADLDETDAQDAVRRIAEAIAAAADTRTLEDVGADLVQWRRALGEERHAALLASYQERVRQLAGGGGKKTRREV